MNKVNVISKLAMITVFTALVSCGGGGGGGGTPATPPDPTGYYYSSNTTTNSAKLQLVDNLLDGGTGPNTGNTTNDLQAIIYNKRFMMMSTSQHLLYDGANVSMGNGTLSGTVTIYHYPPGISPPIAPTTATLSGTVNLGHSITGTLTGMGLGNGKFNLVYASSTINPVADAATVTRALGIGWRGIYGDEISLGMSFLVSSSGSISSNIPDSSTTLSNCLMSSGTIKPITGTIFYDVNVNLSSCNNGSSTPAIANGNYIGLATVRTDTVNNAQVNRLIFIASHASGTTPVLDNTFSAFSECQ